MQNMSYPGATAKRKICHILVEPASLARGHRARGHRARGMQLLRIQPRRAGLPRSDGPADRTPQRHSDHALRGCSARNPEPTRSNSRVHCSRRRCSRRGDAPAGHDMARCMQPDRESPRRTMRCLHASGLAAPVASEGARSTPPAGAFLARLLLPLWPSRSARSSPSGLVSCSARCYPAWCAACRPHSPNVWLLTRRRTTNL
jgi:hypothetical protein